MIQQQCIITGIISVGKYLFVTSPRELVLHFRRTPECNNMSACRLQ